MGGTASEELMPVGGTDGRNRKCEELMPGGRNRKCEELMPLDFILV